MSAWIDRRKSAVLLHITSLPGPFHKGVLGQEAHDFINDLAGGGYGVWQFLPLGPTHGHGSPYESLSTFAGNAEMLDLRDCVAQGWLDGALLGGEMSAKQHKELRDKAGQMFWSEVENNPVLKERVNTFQTTQAYWLNDYALFAALKVALNDLAWWQWPGALRDREPEALQAACEEHAELIQQIVFEQFLFDTQWHALKAHAESRGIQMFGDLPIYVAHDSSDVWAGREFFTLNKKGLCLDVAGVPPDYFSETGQRWGNPLYRWDKMQADGFSWWVRRVSRQLELMHMLRIDHFRALEAFWAIPGDSKDGVVGEWRPAPGEAMLQTLQQELGELPLIAEDLGIITDEVTALREAFGLPGMKILQFAFGGDADNPYLPGNFGEDAVVYTGTHDNDTTMGWFESSEQHVRDHALKILDAKAEDMPWALIESALASPAELAVIPMQDLLALGTEAKFNTPGTLANNWSWRLSSLPDSDAVCWTRSALLNKETQRT
ncbi:4-alpha-glucanotransferase [Mariprofundus sp. EBB-1]|uniref:4-alpha-glucanotransferase n=1 Tax=Mariprofundus sp. EBB-1 TaxID=2650971 RepID=UPI000EF21DB2|nr:4-alpha-glucanotransferase [Mariprofundus sp. EBB-1]RLL55649.1 4-alpha-glucanotransferase [Mariprofundus sp. EBB-1]